jgi:N-acetylmuramoyl-L-alanine amidase
MLNEKFKEFVKAVKATPFEFENLKEIYVAQCLLESDHGNSKLFLNYNNPQGMKYRDEIKDYATKVTYEACDGVDGYANFKNYDNAIKGYWKFIDRSPYQGWRNHISTGKDYIAFIKNCGYATDQDYVSKVLSLVDEAKSLLNEFVGTYVEVWRTEKELAGYKVSLIISEEKVTAPVETKPIVTPINDKKKVALVPGHEPKDEGAYSETLKSGEWSWNLDLVKKIKAELVKLGYDVFICDNSVSVADVANQVNNFDADLSIEFHFNAANGTAKGNETLYTDRNKYSKELAEAVQKAVFGVFQTSDRGLKYLVEGDRGFWNLDLIEAPCCLVEPFFGDNVNDATKAKEKKDLYIKAIVDVIKNWEI